MKIKLFAVTLCTVLFASAFVGCTNKGAGDYKADSMENNVKLNKGDTVVVMDIGDFGKIKIKMYPEAAPKAVENFTTHAKDGYYDGVSFHRVIKDFMIQGGDPDGTGAGGESIWGDNFEDEFKEEYYNFTGALSMANAGVNTNGSQFFIVNTPPLDKEMFGKESGYSKEAVNAYVTRGGTPHLDFKHTVFGMVYSGMDTVNKISNTEVGSGDAPAKDVIIKGISVYTVE